MTRAILAVIGCVLLAGCWVSEQRLFHDGDWAHLDLASKYTSEDANGSDQAHVVLQARPNGLIESTSVGVANGETEHSVLGFVAIEGGSGRYFLLVDRSDPSGDGDFYLIAHLTDEAAIELYWPDCNGTPPIEGVTVERDDFLDEAVCAFSTKAALMRAGLEAERFLSAKHIVAVQPMGKLVPDDDSVEAE
jgi:hypothetical protein